MTVVGVGGRSRRSGDRAAFKTGVGLWARMVRGGLRAMGEPWQRSNPLFKRPPIEKWYVIIGNSIIRYESNETTDG